MVDPNPSRRFRATPAWLIYGLLVVEGLLWLSERFGWLAWHKGYVVLIAVAAEGVAMLVMLLWFVVALVFRWRFQFGIRSLLVLTVAVAIPCSWMAEEVKKATEQRAAAQAINKFGGFVSYSVYGGPLDNNYFQPDSGWLNSLLGDEFVSVTFYNNVTVTDPALEDFKGLGHIRMLILSFTQVSDAGLDHLKGMKQLETLELNGTKVTDAGLERLKGLDQLQRLQLAGTKVTDAGLKHLKGLTKLRQLWLDETQVTEAGLEYLKGLKRLEYLSLSATNVTDASVKNLRQALPKCTIER